jgi:hypothetical protein
MERLKLVRRASGIHSVHGADGAPLGVIHSGDLCLDNDELEELLRKHGERAAAGGVVDEFLRKVRSQMKGSGSSYSEAVKSVALADPVLASEYRRQVMLL